MHPDLLDLLAAFNAEGVRYTLVGGNAISVHTGPRGTNANRKTPAQAFAVSLRRMVYLLPALAFFCVVGAPTGAYGATGPVVLCSGTQPPAEAIANCTKDLKQKLKPEVRVLVLRIRAGAYSRDRKFDEALADVNAALKIDPEDYLSFETRAYIEMYMKNYDSARADCAHVFQTKPENWECRELNGDIDYAHRDYKEAEKDYSRAVASDPQKGEGFLGRALAESRQGKYSFAMADDETTLQLEPDNVPAAINLSYNRLQRYEAEEAIKAADRALQLDPKSADAYEDRARANFIEDKFPQAMADYQQVVQLSPKNPLPHTGMANLLLAQHQFDKALAECEVAESLRPNSGLVEKAVIYFAMDDIAKAMDQANAAITANADNGAAHRVRGNIEFALRKWNDAAADYKKAAELQPESAYPVIWRFLAVARGGGDGKPGLQPALAGLSSADWPMPIGLMFLGKETPKEVLSATSTTSAYRERELKCEANFYIGEMQLLAGHTAEAKADFQNTLDTGVEDFIEYREAKQELKNLR